MHTKLSLLQLLCLHGCHGAVYHHLRPLHLPWPVLLFRRAARWVVHLRPTGMPPHHLTPLHCSSATLMARTGSVQVHQQALLHAPEPCALPHAGCLGKMRRVLDAEQLPAIVQSLHVPRRKQQHAGHTPDTYGTCSQPSGAPTFGVPVTSSSAAQSKLSFARACSCKRIPATAAAAAVQPAAAGWGTPSTDICTGTPIGMPD